MNFKDIKQEDGTLKGAPAAERSAGGDARLPDQFEMLETIGQGNMGIVYKAQNRFTGQIVAIKMLAAGTNDPQALIRFQREGKAACRFAHPNAVTMYDFGIGPDNSPYFVMEFVEGENLASVLNAMGKLDQQKVISIAKNICDALIHAHNTGVVHRDLKPGNIILRRASDNSLTATILDFGIAKFIDDEDSIVDSQAMQKLTATGRLVGTPLYMSPEQCLGQGVDARSDIYSLGAVLYHLLAGVPPHRGATALDTMTKKVDTPAPCFAEHGIKVAPALELAVLKCLKANPRDRYQSATELLTDLQKLAPLAAPTKTVRKISAGHIALALAPIVFAVSVGLYLALGSEVVNLEIKGDLAVDRKAESEAVAQYSQAVSYSKIAHFHLNNSDTTRLLGKLTGAMYRGNMGDKAIAQGEEWRKAAIATGDKDELTDSELLLSQQYRGNDQWERSGELLTACIQRLEATADKSNKQKQNLGLAYLDMHALSLHLHDHEAVKKWVTKLTQYSQAQKNDSMHDYLMWANMGTAQMYRDANDFAEAKNYYEKTWQYLKPQNEVDPTFIKMGKEISTFLSAHGNPALAAEIEKHFTDARQNQEYDPGATK